MIAFVFAPIVAVLTLDAVFAALFADSGFCRRLRRRLRSALLPCAGAPQPISPQTDVVASCDVRRGVFLDCLGGNDGIGGFGVLGCNRHRGDRLWRSRCHLADQPIAVLKRKRCRATRIPIRSKLRILAPTPVANAGA